jgi:hypothetical protein
VGDRQAGRERGANVLTCPAIHGVAAALAAQIGSQWAPSLLYGDGHAAARIAAHLV